MKKDMQSSFSSRRIFGCLKKPLASKGSILLLILLFPCSWLGAQITVTNATFPAAGDTLKTVIATNPAIGIAVYTSPGGPQFWDLSGLQPGALKTNIFKPANQGSVGAQLPGAELFTVNSPGTEDYYNVTGNRFELQAYYGIAPWDLVANNLFDYSPPLAERQAPLNFFDIYAHSSVLLEYFPPSAFTPSLVAALNAITSPAVADSFRYRMAISQTDVVDAWGTISIPGGTYNVLRKKRTFYREARLDGRYPPLGWLDTSDEAIQAGFQRLGVDTIVTFFFYNDVVKEPIAVVTLNREQTAAEQVIYKYNAPVCTAPTVNAPTVTQPGCATPTGTIVVNATGSGTLEYSIDNGSTWQFSATFSGLSPGNYNIVVRNQSEPTCSTVYTGNPVVLNAAAGCCTPPNINASSVTQPTCATPTGTIVVNATGSGTLEYQLNAGAFQTSNTFSGLAPGNYNITVRLQSNPTCLSTYSSNPVVLTAATGCCTPPNINAPSVTQPTCATPTGTIAVNATGSGTLEYQLNAGAFQISNTFSGLAPGNYNITVRLQSSPTCLSAYSGNPVVLTAATGCCVPPVITAPSVTQPTCATPTGTIVVNATGGGTLEYQLNTGPFQTSNTFSGLAPGNYNITVRLQSNPTCLSTYSSNPVVLTAATGCNTCNITCPANKTVNSVADKCGRYVNYPAATTTGVCGNGPFTYSMPSGSWFPVGTTTVTVTSDNGATCSFTVTVNDVQKPEIINPPSDITVNVAANSCSKVVTFPVAATDNCPGVTVVAVPASGTAFNVGITNVVITATDASGNIRRHNFKVTVVDNRPPVITCPPNVVLPTDPGVCRSGVNPVIPSATDNCPGVTVTGTRDDGKGLNATYPVGQTIITWKAKDASGNISTCNQKITVRDMQPPVISNVSLNPSVLWPANNAMMLVHVNYTVTDNCALQNCAPANCRLTVTSNEPVTGAGYGNLSPDWQIIDDNHVKLRAERSANGTGRIYTIKITCKDEAGNAASQTITVTVPLVNTNTRTTNEVITDVKKPQVEELSAKLTAQLMPNPTESEFNLVIKGSSNDVVEIKVYDISGRVVKMMRTGAISVVNFGNNLVQGAYIVEVRQGKEKVVLKAVKQ
jgi:hypothetical protein